MKILIVEDEVLLADSLKAALEQKGFITRPSFLFSFSVLSVYYHAKLKES